MRIMIKKIIVAGAAVLLALVVGPSAFAKDEDHPKSNDHAHFEFRLGEANREFEITGEITSIVGNNFVVSGQTIFIDLSQVSEFREKGILAVGQRVKVKGVVKNGIKFAQDINIIGTGQGRFQFRIEQNQNPAGLGTSTNANVEVKVKTQGAVQEISTFFQQILTLLKSFVS